MCFPHPEYVMFPFRSRGQENHLFLHDILPGKEALTSKTDPCNLNFLMVQCLESFKSPLDKNENVFLVAQEHPNCKRNSGLGDMG